MKTVAMIPSRMASSRFPGKPLANISGLPMIEHVRRRVAMAEGLDDIYVATCDEAIKKTVEDAGGKAIMTSPDHERCTDRLAEAIEQVDADVVLNIQGDEPLIHPEMVQQLIEPFHDPHVQYVNGVTLIESYEEFTNPNVVKAVINPANDVIFLSRQPIPNIKQAEFSRHRAYRQTGLMAFRKESLLSFTKLKPTVLEAIESVDMLRLIEWGYPIRTQLLRSALIGVDLKEDVAKVESALQSDPFFPAYS